MKKYNVKAIMNRAWKIKRQNMENHFGLCLRMAWEEAKAAADKKHFSGYAVEQKVDSVYNMVFKAWSNYGKSRIYITREGYKDSVGYIDLSTMAFVPQKYTCEAFRVDAESFLAKYEIA